MNKRLVGFLVMVGILILGFAAIGTVSLAEENSNSFDVNSIQTTVTKGTVAATILIIREQPGTNYAVVGKLERGTEISIIGQSNNWYQVNQNGTEGWVYGAYVNGLSEGVGVIGTIDNVSRGEYTARSEGVQVIEPVTEASIMGEKIITDTTTHLGKPYRYGSAGPNSFDCSGLLYYVFNANGISVPRSAAGFSTFGTGISLSEAKAGDVICFSANGTRVSHVGLYMGDGKFIHSATSSGVTITAITDRYWNPKIYCVRRIL